MIVATPLNLPRIEPDNWNIFWDIWNEHSADLVKVKQNVSFSAASVGNTSIWKGIDIFRREIREPPASAWSAPFVDIKKSLPKLYNVCSSLPFNEVYRVRLITSLCNITAHTDDDRDRWSVRAYFHYTDNKDQWYLTKPHDPKGQRRYLHVPHDTNWFVYNDRHCWHGTDFNPDHPKILLQVYANISNDDPSIVSSIEKYKEFTISI